MIKVLFVCLGNICRSPLAEAVFDQKIKEKGLSNQITSDSAGTAGYHIGQNPDHRSIAVANKHSIPINHKGRQYTLEDATEFDYILAMDDNNYRDIIHISADKPERLFKMRDFDVQSKGADVPDPYYGGRDGFEHVYEMLDRSSDQLLNMIIEKHNL
jgi:protein-tyrosine phosphatase